MYYNGTYGSTLLVISDKAKGRIKVEAGVITVPVKKLDNITSLCRELKCRTYHALYLDAVLSEKQGKQLFKLMENEVKSKINNMVSLKNI